MVTAAEAAGFAFPALAWLAAWRAGLPSWPLYLLVVGAGALEGAILGFGQHGVLRAVVPVPRKRWVVRTAIAAAFAWAIGMLPGTLVDSGVPGWIAGVVFALLAPALLVSIGIAQWSVLRGHVVRAWRWVLVTTAAWVIALSPTFVIPAEAAFGIQLAGWVVAGLAMASTMAATTGLGVLWLLSQPRK